MKRMSVHVHASSPWSAWTAEMESEIARFARDLASDFGHRARWTHPAPDRGYWRVSAFISARSLREGEEMRREGRRLAKARRLNVRVDF